MIVVDENKFVKNPLVSIRFHAYKQEDYIRQSLDSLLSQETNFEFEIVIGNNPSDDNTRNICIEYQKRYPQIIKLLLHENNIGFINNFLSVGKECRGKYIARCDADDYWIDTHKLQKQVDLMESDNSIGLCYTKSFVYEDSKKCMCKRLEGKPYRGFKQMLEDICIQTLTVMHRRDLYLRCLADIEFEQHQWLMDDAPISLWYAFNSNIRFIDEPTAVYRLLSNSVSHSTDFSKQERFNKSLLEIREYFINRYCPEDDEIRGRVRNDYYRRNIIAAYKSLNVKEYTRYYKKYTPNSIGDFNAKTVMFFKLLVKKLLTKN